MSTTIDEKVVELKFDNSSFEKNVDTSISTIDKLKDSLNFEGATKGLEDVSSAVKSVDMSELGDSVDTVQVKFSALQVIAVSALSTITSQAVSTAQSLISAFTIDPITSGFEEYETQINAVQTILANTESKGTTLEDVNAALDELNTYADKTIYNFTEMTKNIGTFTAAGIDLETSVEAIQGIANLAAVSGSTSTQASTAMYQLSQALAAGKVNLQDWNSVVNAGMGGEIFQNALKETAEAAGTDVDALIEEAGSFRESISEGWITADILTETLTKFTTSGVNEYLAENSSLSLEAVEAMREEADAASDTDAAYAEMAETIAESSDLTAEEIEELLSLSKTAEDAATKVKTFTQLMDTLKEAAQSGWTQTWEIIIGDFEEAKELFTEVSDFFGDLINDSATARNDLLEGAFASSWEQLTVKVEEAGVEVDDFQEALIEVAEANGIAVNEMIDEYGSFEDTLSEGWLTAELFSEALLSMIGDTTTSTEDLTEQLEEFQNVVDDIINGVYGNGEDRVTALTEAGYDYAEMQELVNKVLDGGEVELSDLSDAQLESIGYTEDQIEAIRELAAEAEETGTSINDLVNNVSKLSGRELLIDSFRNIGGSLVRVFLAIKNSFTEVFSITSEQLYNMIDTFHTFTEAITVSEETADKLKRTLKGFTSILNLFTTIIGGGFSVAFKLITKLLGVFDGDLLGVTAKIGDAITEFETWLVSGNKVSTFLNDLADAEGAAGKYEVICNAFQKIKEKIEELLPSGGILDKVRAKFESLKESVTEKISNSDNAIVRLALQFYHLEAVQTIIDKVKTGLEKIYSVLSSMAGSGLSTVKTFVKNLLNLDEFSLENVISTVKQFGSNVIDKLQGFSVDLSSFSTFTSSVASKISSAFETISNAFSTLKTAISTAVGEISSKLSGNIGLGEIFTVGIGAVLIFFVGRISKIVSSLVSPVESLGELLESLGKTLKSFSLKLKGDALKSAAEGILMVAAAIFVLALIDTSKLWSAVLAVAAIAAVLVAITAALSQIKDTDFSGTRLAIAVVALAAGILLMVAALKRISSIDTDELYSSVFVLSIISVVLVALVKFLSGSSTLSIIKSDQKAIKNTASIIAVAVAINLMVSALSKLSKMELDGIGPKLVILAGIMLLLKTVLASCNGIKFGTGISVIAIVYSLTMLVKAFDTIASLDTAQIENNIGAFITIFGSLMVLMLASNLAGENAGKAGISTLAMSASLLIIVRAMKQLAEMDATDLTNTARVIDSLLIIFAAIVAVSNYAGEYALKAGVMILLMSSAIAIIAGVMILLAQLDPSGLGRALAAVAVLEGLMIAMVAVSSLVTSESKTSLIVLAVIIGLLVVALGSLSMIDSTNLMAATVSLGAILLVLAVDLKVLSSMKSDVSGVKSTLIVMAVVVAALGTVLYLLGSLGVENAIGTAAALSILLVAMTASITIISKSSAISTTAYGSLVVMIAVVGLLAVMLGSLNSAGIEVSISTALSLSVLLLAMTAALTILGTIGTLGAAAFVGIAALATLATALWAVSYMLPSIGEHLGSFGENIQPFIDNADGFSKLDASFLTGIKNLIEAVVLIAGANLADRLSSIGQGESSVEAFASNMTALGTAITNFGNAICDLSEDDISKISLACDAGILLADLADSVSGIYGLFSGNGDLDDFGDDINAYGAALVDFAEVVGGENGLSSDDISSIETAVDVSEKLSDLANSLPDTNMFGNSDLSKFGSNLESYAESLVSFAATISETELDSSLTDKVSTFVDLSEALSTVADASTALAEFANSIPNSGGRWADFFGDNNISDFGDDIANYIDSLLYVADACTSEGGLDDNKVSAIQQAAEASSALAEFAESVPNSGGKWAQFFGDNNIADFGADLESYGEALVTFANTVIDISDEHVSAISTAVDASTGLTEFADSVPDSGGAWAKFFGDNNLDTFGTQLSAYGDALYNFAQTCKNLGDEDIEAISNATAVSMELTELANAIPEFGEAGNILNGSDDFSMFGSQLETLGAKLWSYYSYIADVDISSVSSMTSQLNELVSFITNLDGVDSGSISNFTEALSALSAVDVESIASSFSGSDSTFASIGATIVSSIVSGINSSSSDISASFTSVLQPALTTLDSSGLLFYNAGSSLMTNFVNGVTLNTGELSETMLSSIIDCVSAITGSYYVITDSGATIVSKLTSGIESKASALKQAFASMMSSVTSTIKSYYQNFYSAGKYLVQGFAAGISENTYLATAKAKAMASAAAEAAAAELEVSSPSKVGYRIGDYFVTGFANAISDGEETAYDAGSGVASASISGVNSAISKIATLLESDMDFEPTISPVLDLSNVESGVAGLNNMLNMSPSVGVMSNVSAIKLLDADRIQNGFNFNSDVVNAIKDLGSEVVGLRGDTYTINGVTYDDGSNISDAVKNIVRAARVERRK